MDNRIKPAILGLAPFEQFFGRQDKYILVNHRLAGKRSDQGGSHPINGHQADYATGVEFEDVKRFTFEYRGLSY